MIGLCQRMAHSGCAAAALIRDYLGVYSCERRDAPAEQAPVMLGVELPGNLELRPFAWPKAAIRLAGDYVEACRMGLPPV